MDWLVVGLGNPGSRYEGTRHNLGRVVVETLAERHRVALDQTKLEARFGTWRLADDGRACLTVPMTYMNKSGRAVGPLARFYKVPPGHVLVAYDDLDLPLGQLRLRRNGGAGGHNGMASVIRALGTQDFPRLRLGIGRPPQGWDPADFVLARFDDAEQPVVRETIAAGADAAEHVVRNGIEAAMNQFN